MGTRVAATLGLSVIALLAVTLGGLQPGLAQNPQIPSARGESDILAPITDPQLPASAAAPGGDPLGAAFRDARVPLGMPVRGEAFRDLKHDAAANPDPAILAQQADDIEEFAGPETLSHTINVTFVGLDRVTAANGGFVFYPPDTIVAAGPTKVLEATNSALRLFTTAGGVLDTMDLNSFFSAALGMYDFLFDPKVYYDRLSSNQRFFIVALSRNASTMVSRIWFAVSRSDSPTSLGSGKWCRYYINARRNGGTANDSWADYPGIGFGADAMVISVNNFTWATDDFTYAIVRALRKLVLENNAASCPGGSSAAMKTFQASTALGTVEAFNLQPVQHYTSPSSFSGVTNPVYLMATQWGSSTNIRLWRVANVAGTATFTGPYLIPGGLAFDLPPDSPQSGTSTKLSTGDNRMTQAAGLGNVLHGVFATSCNVGGGSVESCVRYVRVQVSGPSLTGSYQQQLTFGGANAFYWWPGVAVNLDKKVLLVYQRGSATTFLSAGYTGKTHSATVFESNNPLTNGTCARTTFGSPARTGDYVGAQTDPGGGKFWLAGERATTIAGLTGCQWETWIRKVTPP